MSKRKRRLEVKIGVFLKQYGRRRHPGHDPNDRRYDRDIERLVKNMDPHELDELMHGVEEEEEEKGEQNR